MRANLSRSGGELTDSIPNLSGETRVYAVFGDPIAQVQTPRLINPIFANAGENIVAVPFHVPATLFKDAWAVFSATSNIAGIGVTVPHKIAAAQLCDTLTTTAKAVGAVNSIQRATDGTLHGALFDGAGFVTGLGSNKICLKDARVLMVGAGGAGRAIAHALASEGLSRLALLDLDAASVAATIAIVNEAAGAELAVAADLARNDYDVIINASPIGIKGTAVFPFCADRLKPSMLVADIAALAGETPLLRAAREIGCPTSDGNDMLEAQIALIAGFAAGRPAGTPLG